MTTDASDVHRLPTRTELEAELDIARQAMIDAEDAYVALLQQTSRAARHVADAVERYTLVRQRYYEDRRWAT